MMTTHDIDILCAAINAGDDSALLPLADALEDAGDPRAAGVRIILQQRADDPRVGWMPLGTRWGQGHRAYTAGPWGWTSHPIINKRFTDGSSVPCAVRNRLGRNLFVTRAAAFLGLAKALSE